MRLSDTYCEMIDLCTVLNKRLYEKDRVAAERVEAMLTTLKKISDKKIDK